MVAYEGNEPYVFISYAHKDKNLVLPIVQGLQDRGFRVWYDGGVEVGNEWPDYIAEHLVRCACVLSFVSRNFGDSHNCRQEFTFSMNLHKDNSIIYLEDPSVLRAGLRMQLCNLHALYYRQYISKDKLLDTLSAAAVLKSCRGAERKTSATFTAEPVGFTSLYQRAQASVAKKTEPKPVLAQHATASEMKRPAITDPEEQYAYGYKLAWGEGGKRNNTEAVKWFKLAAAQNHVKAMEHLGYCFMVGKGVKKDPSEALKWYRSAVTLGSESAKRSLERLYISYPEMKKRM